MRDFFYTYEYFSSQFLGFLVLLIILLLYPKNIKLVLLGGLLAVPQAFCSIFLIPVYWQPELLFTMKPGIEDYMFCFLTGAFVALIIQFIAETGSTTLKSIFKKVLICYIISAAIIIGLIFTGLKSILNPLLFMTLWSLSMLLIFPKYFKLVIGGGIGFLILYTLVFFSVLQMFPSFVDHWRSDNLSGYFLMGIPIEEIAWGFLYGSSWTAALAFILRLETMQSVKSPLNVER